MKLEVMVSPATKQYLVEQAIDHRLPMGFILDRIIAHLIQRIPTKVYLPTVEPPPGSIVEHGTTIVRPHRWGEPKAGETIGRCLDCQQPKIGDGSRAPCPGGGHSTSEEALEHAMERATGPLPEVTRPASEKVAPDGSTVVKAHRWGPMAPGKPFRVCVVCGQPKTADMSPCPGGGQA